MSIKPLIVDWKGLRQMGWPYCRAHTWRMMFEKEYADDPFPMRQKLGLHRNAHPMWRVKEVLAYFKAHGLDVEDDWNSPQ
jgi:hypothetical protein